MAFLRPLFIASTLGTLVLLACEDGFAPDEPGRNGELAAVAVVSAGLVPRDHQVVPIENTLGGEGGFARGINNRNEVVGAARNAEGQLRAFLWKDGTMEELEGLGGAVSGAYAINARGLIVGEAENSDGVLRAVLWVDGVPLELDTPAGGSSQALALNSRGQVAGHFQNADGAIRPFLWSNGEMEELPLPEGEAFFASATGINDRGDVVGTVAGVGQQALLWSRGRVTILETECIEAGAQDINARGQIVGGGLGCPIAPLEVVPLLWNDDRPARHLEPIGGLQEVESGMQNIGSASGLNARGHIVGWSDAAPSVLERDQRATLWYRDRVINLGGEPDFPQAAAINERGVAVGSSSLAPALFVPSSQTELLAHRVPDGLAVTYEQRTARAGADDPAGSRASESWAVALCAATMGTGGPPTVAGILAGC